MFHDEHGANPAGSWLRSTRWSQHTPYTQEEGALIYAKVPLCKVACIADGADEDPTAIHDEELPQPEVHFGAFHDPSRRI